MEMFSWLQGGMELMFIIAAKQLNMFRGGNGLPASIG